jgi:hypothetical protein
MRSAIRNPAPVSGKSLRLLEQWRIAEGDLASKPDFSSWAVGPSRCGAGNAVVAGMLSGDRRPACLQFSGGRTCRRQWRFARPPASQRDGVRPVPALATTTKRWIQARSARSISGNLRLLEDGRYGNSIQSLRQNLMPDNCHYRTYDRLLSETGKQKNQGANKKAYCTNQAINSKLMS